MQVFLYKYNSNRYLDKFKIHFVVQKNIQRKSIYNNIYIAILVIYIVQVFIVIATFFNLDIY